MQRKTAVKYLSFALGTGILAFGLFNIHARTGISEGGVLGLSLLIYHWLNISPGISGFLLDMISFGIGTCVIGGKFLRDSVAASAMYACWYRIWEQIGPLLPDLSALPFAAALLGGIFVGVGCGLVVRYDCAAGGDDALAIVFHKLTGRKVSCFYVVSDFTVLMLSLSYIPARRIVWSLFSVLVSSAVIELLRALKRG